MINEHRRQTLREIAMVTGFSKSSILGVLSEDLNMSRIYACLVPWLLKPKVQTRGKKTVQCSHHPRRKQDSLQYFICSLRMILFKFSKEFSARKEEKAIKNVGFTLNTHVSNVVLTLVKQNICILSTASTHNIKAGDKVRVKPSVLTPTYKWGSVSHNSIGTVTSINPNGRDIMVDFPQQAHWTGVIDEMEIVPSTHSGIG